MSNTTGSTKVLNAVIIGCGAIAGGYDEGQSSADVLTHAKAYQQHPGLNLVGCVEPDQDRREQFMKAWDIKSGFSNLEELIAGGIDFDVASICTPTPHHADALEKLLNHSIKGVLCEKPLSDDLKTSSRLVEAYAKSKTPLAVNYLRRWDEALGHLKKNIADNQWGHLQTAVCHYGKGIRHNGGHMIDILQYLFGPLTPDEVFHQQTDYIDSDPTLDALLQTQTGASIKLIGTDSRLYDVFEATLTFEKGQIVLEQGMSVIRERPADDNPRFSGHRALAEGTRHESAQGQALYRAVDNLYKAVTEGATLASDGRTALAAQEVCEKLLKMAPQQ
ncbi:MAG: Gfo/Idh/MocA family protein [Rhodospirillales bacterium]|jgi:predicted dehydrogenase